MNKIPDSVLLKRFEFVEDIVDFLKNRHGLRIESHTDRYVRFYKGKFSDDKLVAIVGYGGSGTNLRDLPTPLQTEILPLIFKHWKAVSGGNEKVPLLILGHSFDEVFLRKIRLLKAAIPDLRLMQYINVDRLKTLESRFQQLDKHYKNVAKDSIIRNEKNDFLSAVVEYLKSEGELSGYSYDVLDYEVPAGEGTIKSEMIDILALERKRKWLTVIELKYEKLTNIRLQSVIFQGLDYCNWVEDHKRGLAMLFPQYKIDTRRRTRLILINGPGKFPEFQLDFAKLCNASDRYQQVEFYHTNDRLPLSFTSL